MNRINNIPISLKDANFLCASFKSGDEEAICFYKGTPKEFSDHEVLVRIHSGCITSEVFGMTNCDCKWQLDFAMEKLKEVQCGILIYLPGQEGNGHGIFNKIRSFEMMNLGLSSKESYEMLQLPADVRNYDFAINIIKSFGIKKIKLITNSPSKVMACIDGGLIISKRIPALMENPNVAVSKLLESKKLLFNHYID